MSADLLAFPAARAQNPPIVRVSIERPIHVCDGMKFLRGRRVEEVAIVLPLIFNLCKAAHGAASALALGLDLGAEAPRRVAAEIVREHLFHILHRWPAALDEQRSGADLSIASIEKGLSPQGDECRALAHHIAEIVFGEPCHVFLARQQLASWLAYRPTATAAALATVFSRWGAELRVSAGADERDPTFHSRVRHHPLVAAFENGGRPSLMSRMAARLVEVAALLEALAKDTLPDIYHPVRVGAGAAAVCAARGQLFHEAEVTNGVVSLYRITTPTDWMLAQGGLLDQIIAAFEANPPTFQRSALTLLIGSIDPGVPYRIEEVEDA